MPNLFCFATKELSQDAMLCWLLSWANPEHKAEDPELHACGVRFVNALRRKHGKPAIGVKAVEVLRQYRRIDVLIRVNGEHVFLIEDKTSASDNEAKLKREYDSVSSDKTGFGPVARNDIYPTYLKTGNYQLAERQMVEKAGYKFFDRRDFLGVLKGYRGVNAILVDYRDYLQYWEDDTESYRNWQAGGSKQWSWSSWEGFLRILEAALCPDGDRGGWGDVHNRAGEFLGFWWDKCDELPGSAWACLQLEVVPGRKRGICFQARLTDILLHEVVPGRKRGICFRGVPGPGPAGEVVPGGKRDLCFKIGVEKGKKVPRDLAQRLGDAILAVSDGRVKKPRLKGGVRTMTVAVWADEWLSFGKNGKIDPKRTVENLREAEGVLQEAVKRLTP